MSSRSARAIVSASAAVVDISHAFTTTFSRLPVPAGPNQNVRAPTASNTGAQRSRTSSGPEARMVSSPRCAGPADPRTGASTNWTSWSVASAASRSAAGAPTVPIWIQTAPAGSAARAPSGPPSTASVTGPSASIVTSTSTSAAAASGVSAACTPSAASASALAGVRFHATTGSPARARLRAMGAPIVPVPSSAMVISIDDPQLGGPRPRGSPGRPGRVRTHAAG